MGSAKQIVAKFSGTCRACGGAFVAGQMIAWSKESGSAHTHCVPSVAPEPPPKPAIAAAIELLRTELCKAYGGDWSFRVVGGGKQLAQHHGVNRGARKGK